MSTHSYQLTMGVNLQILSGQDNYNAWVRDFKLLAKAEGIWQFYQGSEPLLSKPNRDDYHIPQQKKKRVSADDSIVNSGNTSIPTTGQLNTLETNIVQYKLDVEEWKEHDKRVRRAQTLLPEWVDPAIRGKLEEYENPKDAWDYLQSQYKMTNARALDIALSKMGRLRLQDCKSMQDYLNQHEILKLDIVEAKGVYDDSQLISKIFRGLSFKYNNFVDQYHLMNEDENVKLKDITTKLLTYESKLLEREAEARAYKNSRDNKNNKDNKDDKDSKDSKGTGYDPDYKKKKCDYAPCGKFGHLEEDCRLKKRHLSEKETGQQNEKSSHEDKKDGRRQIAAMVSRVHIERINRITSLTRCPGNRDMCHMGTPIQPPRQNLHADLPFQNNEKDWQEGKGEGGVMEQVLPLDRLSMQNQTDTYQTSLTKNDMTSALVCSNGPEKNTWIADTGAITHIANDRAAFKEIHDTETVIGTADEDSSLHVHGAGSVGLTMTVEGEDPTDFLLSEAVFAPNSSCNLLSLQMLATKAGMHGTWDKDKITICTKQGDLVGQAHLRDGMYHVEVESRETKTKNPPIAAATVDFDDPVWKWHRKLGHLSWENMRKLLKMSQGINLTDKQIKAKVKAVCPVCAITKAQTRIPRDPARRRFKGLGELLIFDTWGPYSILGIGEVRYAIFGTDDATRATWVEFFSRKNEITHLMKRMCKKIETTHNVVIRHLRFDNEFNNDEVQHFARQHGISLEPSVPYAHHQVGTQERANRTVRDKAAPMLQELSLPSRITKIIIERGDEMLRNTSLPESIWPEAIKHSVWLKCRAPTKALKYKKTPFEAIEGIRPDFSRDRIWGSRSYVTTPPELRVGQPKLHTPRAWIGYFVGCESESVYRIWNPDTQKVSRISMARIDDGMGQDDFQNEESVADKVTPLSIPEEDESALSTASTDVSITTSPGSQTEDDVPSDKAETAEISGNNTERSVHSYQSESDEPSDKEQVVSRFFTHTNLPEGTKVMMTIPQPLKEKCAPCARNRYRCDGNAPCDTCIRRKVTCPATGVPRIVGMIPDDTKCDYCMKSRSRCDGNRPCQTCIQRHKACQEQTETTKALIPVENRHLLPVPRIASHAAKNMGPRCKACNDDNRHCDRNDPCGQCTRLNIECQPNENIGVPHEDKCQRCMKKGYRCDGFTPCARCEKDKKKLCIPAGIKLGSKCSNCANQGNTCDRGKPCSTCVKQEHVCSYVIDGSSFLRRVYNIPEKESVSRDDAKCRNCSHRKRICSGTEPCYRCVKHGEDICTYRKSGNMKEMWDVTKFKLNEDDEVVLDERDQPKKKRTRKKQKFGTGGFDNSSTDEHDSPTENDTDSLDEDIRPSKKKRINSPIVAIASKRVGDEPRTYKAAMRLPDAPYYREAVKSEMQSIITNTVFEVVDQPPGRKAISTRWVFNRKIGPKGQIIKYKARLVGRGFQQHEGLDFNETYSGVVKPTAYRTLFALSAIYGWTSHQMDVKTAFLNADMKEELYVKPPPPFELPKEKVWRMLRALYGFKQSPRAWYEKLDSELKCLGFRQSNFDQCVFIHTTKLLIMAIHVDDIRLFSDQDSTIHDFKTQISSVFEMTDESPETCYLGMHVEQVNGSIKLHQSAYISKILNRFGLSNLAPVYTPSDPRQKLVKERDYKASEEFTHKYLSMFGSLNYLPTIARPDIAYAVSVAGRYNSNPTQDHMDAITRVYAYLVKTQDHGIYYDKSCPELKGYVDSDYAGCSDTSRSTTGWIFTLAGGPISWSSKRQQTVSLSSTEAEYMAATEAAKEAVWIKNFINDLDIGYTVGAVQLNIDNNSTIKVSKNPEFHQRMKHIQVRHNFIRESIRDGHIDARWIPTKDNLADAFTKALGRPTFEKLVQDMGMSRKAS